MKKPRTIKTKPVVPKPLRKPPVGLHEQYLELLRLRQQIELAIEEVPLQRAAKPALRSRRTLKT